MFYGDYSLENLDLSSFDTSKVKNFDYLFYGCSALTKLNLNNFVPDNLESYVWIFADCYNLSYIDISKSNIQYLNEDYFYFFHERRANGTVKYNSNLFKEDLIDELFEGGEKIDINSS